MGQRQAQRQYPGGVWGRVQGLCATRNTTLLCHNGSNDEKHLSRVALRACETDPQNIRMQPSSDSSVRNVFTEGALFSDRNTLSILFSTLKCGSGNMKSYDRLELQQTSETIASG